MSQEVQADLYARLAIDGVSASKLFKDDYTGHGFISRDGEFERAFIKSLVNHAVNKVIREDSFEGALPRFEIGKTVLSPWMQAEADRQLKVALLERVRTVNLGEVALSFNGTDLSDKAVAAMEKSLGRHPTVRQKMLSGVGNTMENMGLASLVLVGSSAIPVALSELTTSLMTHSSVVTAAVAGAAVAVGLGAGWDFLKKAQQRTLENTSGEGKQLWDTLAASELGKKALALSEKMGAMKAVVTIGTMAAAGILVMATAPATAMGFVTTAVLVGTMGWGLALPGNLVSGMENSKTGQSFLGARRQERQRAALGEAVVAPRPSTPKA